MLVDVGSLTSYTEEGAGDAVRRTASWQLLTSSVNVKNVNSLGIASTSERLLLSGSGSGIYSGQ